MLHTTVKYKRIWYVKSLADLGLEGSLLWQLTIQSPWCIQLSQRSPLLLWFASELPRILSYFKIWISNMLIIIASWIYLPSCRCILGNLSMSLQYLSVHGVNAGGSGSMRIKLAEWMRLTWMCGTCISDFSNVLHFAETDKYLCTTIAIQIPTMWESGRYSVSMMINIPSYTMPIVNLIQSYNVLSLCELI